MFFLLVLGVILEFVYFVLSIDILQQVWERMPKTIASLSSGAEWVSKAGLRLEIWNAWASWSRLVLGTHSANCQQLTVLSNIFCKDTG